MRPDDSRQIVWAARRGGRRIRVLFWAALVRERRLYQRHTSTGRCHLVLESVATAVGASTDVCHGADGVMSSRQGLRGGVGQIDALRPPLRSLTRRANVTLAAGASNSLSSFSR